MIDVLTLKGASRVVPRDRDESRLDSIATLRQQFRAWAAEEWRRQAAVEAELVCANEQWSYASK